MVVISIRPPPPPPPHVSLTRTTVRCWSFVYPVHRLELESMSECLIIYNIYIYIYIYIYNYNAPNALSFSFSFFHARNLCMFTAQECVGRRKTKRYIFTHAHRRKHKWIKQASTRTYTHTHTVNRDKWAELWATVKEVGLKINFEPKSF